MFLDKHVTLLLLCALIPIGQSNNGKHQFLLTEAVDSLTIERVQNLQRILEFIRRSPDFHPLTISVVSSSPRGSIPEYVSKFIARNSIDAYQLTTGDLTDKSINNKWQTQVDLTWIFLVEDLYTLRSFVEFQRKFWKPTSQYVMVFYDEKANVSWKRILEQLWRKYNVCRAIVTLLQDDFRWFMKYAPFELLYGEFGRVRKVYVTEDSGTLPYMSDDLSIGEDDLLFFASGSRIFETYEDMNGYPINITAFQSLTMRIDYNTTDAPTFSGLDADMLNTFETGLNCKFRVNIIEQMQYTDPFELSLKHIEEGQTEIVATSFFTKDYDNYPEQEFTSGTYEDKMCFIAPQARLVPKAYMPVVPFPRKLWNILAIYNLVITVLWILVKHWSRSLNRQRSQINLPSTSVQPLKTGMTLMPRYVWQTKSDLSGEIIVRQPQELAITWWTMKPIRDEPPEIHSQLLGLFNLIVFSCYPLKGGDTTAQRTFLVGTLFFSILISGFYQSRLVSSFSKPYSYRQIDTVQDVINSNYSVVTKYSNLRNVFADSRTSVTERQIFERMQVIASNSTTYEMVAYEHVISLGRLLSIELEDLTYLYDDEGRCLLHVVTECPATYMLSYVVRKHSPYLDRLDAIILRLQQAGIIRLWLSNMKLTSDKVNQRFQVTQMERKRKLSLEHYSLTFLGLFIGLVCSFLIFMGELYYARNTTMWYKGHRKTFTFIPERREKLLSIKGRFP